MPYSKVALMRKHTVRLLLEGYGLSSLLRQTTVVRSKHSSSVFIRIKFCIRDYVYKEQFVDI